MTTLLKVVIQNFAEKIWPNFFIRINFLIGIFSMKLSLKKKVPASFSVLETRQLSQQKLTFTDSKKLPKLELSQVRNKSQINQADTNKLNEPYSE